MSSPTDLPPLPEVATPVTSDRLLAHAAEAGWTVDTAEATVRRRTRHGEVTAALPAGETPVLLFRGVRNAPPVPDRLAPDLEAFVNDWHRERVWPTVVLRSVEGGVAVHAHVGIDVAAGLTDEQLREYLRLGVGTVQQCFEHLDAAPGLATPSADPEPG